MLCRILIKHTCDEFERGNREIGLGISWRFFENVSTEYISI